MYDILHLYEPSSLHQALMMRQEHPQALILAGGSDILIKLRNGVYSQCSLISIYGLDELRGISLEPNGDLLIRPLSSFTAVANHPLINKHIPVLAEALLHIGGPQIRNIGTIGGNICNGVTSADSASTLKAYDAMLTLSSLNGSRTLPYVDFNKAPQVVDIKEGEILTEIRIAQSSYEQTYGHYIKYAMRKAMDIATLGCSVNVRLTNDCKSISRLRMAFGVAAPIPIRCPSAEQAALGSTLTSELIEKIAQMATADLKPRTSWRASKEFRLHLAHVLAERATKAALEKAGGIIDG